jgi:hypothetical protein
MNDSDTIEKIKIIKEAIKIEENALSCTNSHKKKMEIYKTIEFLNWRLAQIKRTYTQKSVKV